MSNKYKIFTKVHVMTVKNAPKIMVWGVIAAHGRFGLWFIPPYKSINGVVYLNILKKKLTTFITKGGCSHLLHDSSPWQFDRPKPDREVLESG